MIKNIVLDFGHGGIDENGNYTTNGKQHEFPNGEIAYEGEINRKIGGMLRAFLRMLGDDYNIITTVDEWDSNDPSLAYRVAIANGLRASETIFISIHNNAFNTKARGFEIYTTPGVTGSDLLAQDIFDAVMPVYSSMGLKMRKDTTDGDSDKEANFYVLRKTRCEAVLIECLFFDNREDFELLKNPAFVKELAWGIFTGIWNYTLRC